MCTVNNTRRPAMETEHGGESVRRDNGHSDDPYKNGKEYPATVRGSRSIAASDGSVVLEHMFEGHRVRTVKPPFGSRPIDGECLRYLLPP